MKRIFTWGPALLAISLCGCFGVSKESQIATQNQRHIFAPGVKVASAVVEKPKFQEVKLRPFQIVPPFGGRLFVVARKGHEFAADYYNGWVTAPEDLIAVQTWRYLEKSNLFDGVSPVSTGSIAPLGLDGIVTGLYLDYRDPSRPKACVGLRISILDELKAEFPILLTVEKSASVPFRGSGSHAGAEAFSQALEKTLAEIVAELKKSSLKR